MATIKFANGQTVKFNGNPTPQDVEFVAQHLGIKTEAPAQPSPPTSDVPYPAQVGKDTALQASGKMLGNFLPDAWDFGKGILKGLNPISNVKNIVHNVGELATGIPALVKEAGGAGQATKAFAREVPGTAYKALVPQAVQQGIAGDWEGAQKTLVEHPVKTIAPIVGAARSVGELFKSPEGVNPVDTAISDIARPVLALPRAGLNAAKNGLLSLGRQAASQVSGLDPQTIKTVAENPEAFSNAEKSGMARSDLGGRVKSAFESMKESKSDTGTGYDALREDGYPVTIPKGTTEGILAKHGIRLDEAGKVILDEETPPLKPGDINAIEKFYEQYGNKGTLSTNGFMNSRQSLDQMAGWDSTKSSLSKVIAKDLRSTYDTLGKGQITETTTSPSLSELDQEYAPQVKPIQLLQKDFFNPDGTLKDGALSKIANATGAGKDSLLARLEDASPGITKDINIVKALEDIQNTQGQKVGTYVRAGILGGGVLTGNVPAIIASIIGNPKIFIPLLKAYGAMSKVNVNPIITKVVNGVTLSPAEQSIVIAAAQAQEQLKKPDLNSYDFKL